MPKYDAIDYPIVQIRAWIQDGWTQQRIADELSKTLDPRVTAKLIYKVCKKNGIACQRTGPRAGEGHPEWKGGRIVNKDGYVEIYCPGHPNAKKYVHYILEHRLVMEEVLGRYLTRSEVVHHKNGNKQDNRPENLELFQANGKHLAATLKGETPKWTPEGRAKTMSVLHSPKTKEKIRRAGKTRVAIRAALGLGVFPNKQTTARYLSELGITFAEACEMVHTLGSLPSLPRPMPPQKSLP